MDTLEQAFTSRILLFTELVEFSAQIINNTRKLERDYLQRHVPIGQGAMVLK